MRCQEELDKAVALTDLNDRPRSLHILLEPLPDTGVRSRRVQVWNKSAL